MNEIIKYFPTDSFWGSLGPGKKNIKSISPIKTRAELISKKKSSAGWP